MRDTNDDGIRDPVADALLGDSPYEQLRLRRFTPFAQPIPTKLAWQSGLLFLLALMLPLMASFPAEVRSMLGGTAASSSPKVLLLGVTGGVGVFVGGLVLTVVGVLRVRLEPRMTEDQAYRLLGIEDVASMLGIGTAGLVVLLTMAYVVLGAAGTRAVEGYIEVTGYSPFAPSGVEPVTVGGVATLAFVGSVALLVASHALHAEFRLHIDEGGGHSSLDD